MAFPVRTYKVINSSTLTDKVVRFRTSAPAGSVGTMTINGHRTRVVLHGYQVHDERGPVYAAELLDNYL
ncbi:hypothetical protein [Streptomyces sp. NPDC057794]|uniref:hypothetical protein n=1 Tax=Streptomyces sp. NPDC057794 TaxID=3346251 RepID=UPI00369F750C